jgi:molybdopterin-guanine dinucleotide biosynthesis protein A
VLIDALVLAGGRSSRMDSIPKAQLRFREHTLLENTVAAASGVRCTVVVGDTAAQSLPANVLVTREKPAFGGPASAIGAGLDLLLAAHPVHSAVTVVLACDLPNVERAVQYLVRELRRTGITDDGLIAVDSAGRLQPLLAAYSTPALVTAIALQRETGTLDGLSVFHLIRALTLHQVKIPDEATADVDTWADAEQWGIKRTDIQTTTKGEQ